jgi:NADH-quinone oxidoreductase subunit M
MLLSFLGLYLSVEPHTFSISAIARAAPPEGFRAGGLLFLGMLLGFGVKIPILPIHNWLPDAHVEAPTEGSVILAGLLLKMGGYGLFRVLLPALPVASAQYGWVLLGIGVLSIVYGAFAALGQQDFKRLIAYTSVSHMGFVVAGAAVAALSNDPAVRTLAIVGATYQMVSHGLLTSGMFLLVGMLEEQAHTRELRQFGGLLGKAPRYSAVLAVLAFGSLGLPGLSGFIAEMQVIGAALSLSIPAAIFAILGALLTTGLYLHVLVRLVMGKVPDDMPSVADPPPRKLGLAALLGALSLALGIWPSPLLRLIQSAWGPLERTASMASPAVLP